MICDDTLYKMVSQIKSSRFSSQNTSKPFLCRNVATTLHILFCEFTPNRVKQLYCQIQIGIDFEIAPICGFHFPPFSPQEGRTNGLNF